MTLENPSAILDRFHQALVDEIRSSVPRYLEEPFTVSEIYQHLVPYRTHRDAIGVEINGDYEDALLRLLGGEGGYLELDSDAALQRIREELETQNPNTTLYRDYAAVEVRLNPERLAGLGPADPEDEPWTDLSEEMQQMPDPRTEPPDECRSCAARLPQRDDLVFCPHCGVDQRMISCPSCGTDLEPEWRFCVSCGQSME